MKKYKYLIFLSVLLYTFINTYSTVLAVCPVCTVAIGAGLGLSRWFGIDDIISGLWVGGLIMSSAYWTVSFLESKKRNFRYSTITMIFLYFAIIYIPLFISGIIGHKFNSIFGIDKLLFGSLFGSLLFQLSQEIEKILRRKNNGKVYFPYQKVIIPIGILIVASLIFFLIV